MKKLLPLRDPYLVVAKAAAMGKGCHLDAEECGILVQDEQFMAVARNALTSDEVEKCSLFPNVNPRGWKDLDLHRERDPNDTDHFM